MNVIWFLFLIYLLQAEADTKRSAKFPLELPCEFSFTKETGYTCRVTNFVNLENNVNVSKITGQHLNNFQDSDVTYLSFWNLTIDYLPENITNHLTSLKTLQVKNCGLKFLTCSANFINLKRLYLGFNEIKNIPKMYFWNFCRLEVLSLFNNLITSIPPMAFRDLINLKYLSLNSNRLKSIDSKLFENCENLEVVDLSSNQMEIIREDLFANQKNLRKIFMQNNKLKAIDSSFLTQVNFSSLVIADFSKNSCIDFRFERSEEFFSYFEKFQKVFAKNCQLFIEERKTITRKPTKPRKKPKYQKGSIIYYKNCQWKVRAEFQHLYKSFLSGLNN